MSVEYLRRPKQRVLTASVVTAAKKPGGGGGGGRKSPAVTPSSGPPPVAPAEASGLYSWHEADAITPQADDTTLGSWADGSGNGYTLTQATEAAKPRYRTARVNGLPSVQFNGAQTIRSATLTARSATGWCVAVVKFDATASDGHVLDGQSSSARSILGVSAATGVFMQQGAALASNLAAPQPWAVWAAVFNGATSVLYLNGVQVAAGNAGTQLPNAVHMGADRFGTAAFLVGEVAARVVGTGADTDVAGLTAHFMDKYGITA